MEPVCEGGGPRMMRDPPVPEEESLPPLASASAPSCEDAAQSTAKAEAMVDSGESVHRLVPEAEQVPARPPACPRSQVRAVLRQGLGAPERWTA
jgi:hypothetical protein